MLILEGDGCRRHDSDLYGRVDAARDDRSRLAAIPRARALSPCGFLFTSDDVVERRGRVLRFPGRLHLQRRQPEPLRAAVSITAPISSSTPGVGASKGRAPSTSSSRTAARSVSTRMCAGRGWSSGTPRAARHGRGSATRAGRPTCRPAVSCSRRRTGSTTFSSISNGSNSGDSGDPFPGSSDNRSFGPSTDPAELLERRPPDARSHQRYHHGFVRGTSPRRSPGACSRRPSRAPNPTRSTSSGTPRRCSTSGARACCTALPAPSRAGSTRSWRAPSNGSARTVFSRPSRSRSSTRGTGMSWSKAATVRPAPRSGRRRRIGVSRRVRSPRERATSSSPGPSRR